MNPAKIQINDLSVYYDSHRALNDITLPIYANEILAVFGPAHSGRSTLLRTLNRLNDLIDSVVIDGQVLLDGMGHDDDGIILLELLQ